MNLALKDGKISLTVALGTGELDTAIDPDNVRFDDNLWHHVLVQRHSSAVSISCIFCDFYYIFITVSKQTPNKIQFKTKKYTLFTTVKFLNHIQMLKGVF